MMRSNNSLQAEKNKNLSKEEANKKKLSQALRSNLKKRKIFQRKQTEGKS